MKKSIVFLSLFILFGLTTNAQSFSKISKKISAYQLKNGIRKVGNDTFNKVRLKLDSLGKLSFIENASQIFFLESYEVESGTIYGFIWDGKNNVNYSYYQGIFSFDEGIRFTKYMVKLVESWDINTIRKEEIDNANIIPTSLIYATRVIKKKKCNIAINALVFKDFFKLDRDR
jgi:hypothetical protein